MNALRANTIRHSFSSINGHMKRAFLNHSYRTIITTVDIPKVIYKQSFHLGEPDLLICFNY
jgi:hypothetical protein